MTDHIRVDAAEPVFGIQIGQVRLRVHSGERCHGTYCCIHNPSDHHMVTWKQNWRADRYLMERLCPHGIGHPDPDDIAYKRRTRGEYEAAYESVHGCDGCCIRSTDAVG